MDLGLDAVDKGQESQDVHVKETAETQKHGPEQRGRLREGQQPAWSSAHKVSLRPRPPCPAGLTFKVPLLFPPTCTVIMLPRENFQEGEKSRSEGTGWVPQNSTSHSLPQRLLLC